MQKRTRASESDFERTTRDWIVRQVGLYGFYEICKLKKLEREGQNYDKWSLPVEFTAIISAIKEKKAAYVVPYQARKQFDTLVYNERRTRDLRTEGERAVILEGEFAKRMSRYTKLFKVFPSSGTLSDSDTNVLSSLYEKAQKTSGGVAGPLFFHKLEGRTARGHVMLAYLLSESSALGNKTRVELANPGVVKRIFVKTKNGFVEKDPLTAASGMFRARNVRVSKSGVVFSRKTGSERI